MDYISEIANECLDAYKYRNGILLQAKLETLYNSVRDNNALLRTVEKPLYVAHAFRIFNMMMKGQSKDVMEVTSENALYCFARCIRENESERQIAAGFLFEMIYQFREYYHTLFSKILFDVMKKNNMPVGRVLSTIGEEGVIDNCVVYEKQVELFLLALFYNDYMNIWSNENQVNGFNQERDILIQDLQNNELQSTNEKDVMKWGGERLEFLYNELDRILQTIND
ncbi:hypothetical protein [Bacteroides intestinalis]|uniref:hypothetical protein n=1 Tax=Bacteroides intestinalis TaxID=329854 RepID=UPI001C70F586|nr:hypothetical protein [Bacteroides intestinalis]